MSTSDSIFSALLIICLVCAVIGLFNPMLFLPSNREYKHPHLSILGLFSAVFLVICALFLPLLPPAQEVETTISDQIESKAPAYNFAFSFAMIAFIFLIVGLFNPHIFLPRKWAVKHPRLLVSGVFGIIWIVLTCISPVPTSETTEKPKDEASRTDFYLEWNPLVLIKVMDAEKAGLLVPSTTKIKKHSNKVFKPDLVMVQDTIWADVLTHHFDSLYNRLMDCDKPETFPPRRSDIHRQIKHFIYDGWWEIMEKYDSSRVSLPLSRKEYAKACKKYDKEYARFLKYGDEDMDQVEYWAKAEAERVLRQLLKDPRSLDIIGVTSIKKISKGYRCNVQYRAKNSFGGYVVEGIQLDLAYDEDQSWYRAFDARFL